MSQIGHIRYAGLVDLAETHECNALEKANPTAMMQVARVKGDETWSIVCFTEIVVELIDYCPFCGEQLQRRP